MSSAEWTLMLGAWHKDFNLNLLPKQSFQTVAPTEGPPQA